MKAKVLKWIGQFFLLYSKGEEKEEKENDKKSNDHSENSASIKSIHWVVVFDMFLSFSFSRSLFFLLLLSLSIDVGSWHSKEKRRQIYSHWFDWKEKKSIQSENTISEFLSFSSTKCIKICRKKTERSRMKPIFCISCQLQKIQMINCSLSLSLSVHC